MSSSLFVLVWYYLGIDGEPLVWGLPGGTTCQDGVADRRPWPAGEICRGSGMMVVVVIVVWAEREHHQEKEPQDEVVASCDLTGVVVQRLAIGRARLPHDQAPTKL